MSPRLRGSWAAHREPAGVLTLLGLARVGRLADRPIVGRAVVRAEVPRLTDDIVLTGLAACGVNPKHVGFTDPIQRDGPGWRAEVELPHSVVTNEIIAKREKLAGGLRRQLGCVWPEPNAREMSRFEPGSVASHCGHVE